MHAFLKGMTERAVKTAAQAFVATIGVNAVGVTDVSWATVLSVTALATILSIATSIGNFEFTAGTTTDPGVSEDYLADQTDETGTDELALPEPGEVPPTELDHDVLEADDPNDVPARYAAE